MIDPTTTVEEAYTIEEESINQMVDETGDEYWEQSQEFWLEVREREVGSLSPKQITWLEKIEGDISDYDGI